MTCDACDRDATVVMGSRGPVAAPLFVVRIGHFRFCTECLIGARLEDRRVGAFTEELVRTVALPSDGHTWITRVREADRAPTYCVR